MSTIYTVDWAQYLSPDSELPPDVIFNVVQSSGTYKDTNFTLESEEITIMDSDCFAFQKMINYIYSKDYSCDDIRDSFEILKMGDKYDLKELVILSRRSIDNYVISGQNVAKVLHVVEVYKNLEGFDDICEGLLARCRKFVSDSMRTAQDVFNLLAINSDEDDEVETDLLVKLLRETARCRNCKMHPNECLNGQKVTYDNMITGGKQRVRANSTFQSLSNWTTLEKTVGHISAFSKEDSVHYYTPGGMALRYCYKFGVKWNNTGWLGTKEPLIEAHYLEIPDVSYHCEELE